MTVMIGRLGITLIARGRINHQGHEAARSPLTPGFPSCTFVPFVVKAFRSTYRGIKFW